ncbi:hypothetical protein ES703_11321 [subsurface metagenome]
MRQIYINKWSEVVDASHSKYILSDVVNSGYILHVHTCFCHAPSSDTGDIISFGVRDGIGDVVCRSRGCTVRKEGMSALRDFFVGEGDQIFAHFPDAAVGHVIGLHIIGCLLSIDEYREKGE